MDIQETSLPGVGERFDVPLGDGSSLCIVIHNTGKREIYRKESEDSDGELLASLTDREARVVGTVLEGAYFQPVQSETVETLLEDDVLLEWIKVDETSSMVSRSFQNLDLRQRTGAAVIAILREGDTIVAPEGSETIHAGDTLIAIGPSEAQQKLEELAGGPGTE